MLRRHTVFANRKFKFTENFEYPDGALPNGWLPILTGNFTGKTANVVARQLAPSASSGRYAFLRPESLLDTVQEVIQVSRDTGFGGGGVLLARMQNDQNGYFIYYGTPGGGGGIYRIVNNVSTLISATTTRTPVANDRLRLTVQGSSLKFEILANGVVVSSVTATDTTFTGAGKCGLGEAFGGAVLDDYSLRQL
jgi:hypothetical protein